MNRYTMALFQDQETGEWWSVTDDPEVKRLFGTNELPLAYTPAAPASMVLAGIARKNPDMRVIMLEAINE